MKKNCYDIYTLTDLLAENKAAMRIYINGYSGGQKKELWLNYDEGTFTDDARYATLFNDWRERNGIYSYVNAVYIMNDLSKILEVHTELVRGGKTLRFDVTESMIDVNISRLLPEERKILQEAGYTRCGRPLVIERKKNARKGKRDKEARPGDDRPQSVPSMERDEVDMPQPRDKRKQPV